ncbi:hypothetical protein ACWERV_29145 [Streptomyces sp. NPDC004031]
MKTRQEAAGDRAGAPDTGEGARGVRTARRSPARAAGAAALAAGALAAVLAAPAQAQAAPADAAVPALPGVPANVRGLQGPVVTHPDESPRDYPAGEVCAFPTHTEFPVSDLRMRTWTDSAGTPVFSIEDGPLLMKVTNLDSGESIVRDISGTGVITYPTPDSYVLSGNDWSAGFHTTDRPVHNKWIVASTFMSVKVTTVGGTTSRELLALSGPSEDICTTLS